MELFFKLFVKIIFLYMVIFLGFIASKKLNAKKETIASILIYIIVPFIVFNSLVNMKLNISLLFLPVIFFIFCCCISLVFYYFGKKIFHDNTANILAFSSGTANTGYLGIPVAIELFGENILGIMVLGIFGFTVFENTLGFFLTAKGNYSTEESIKRVFKLPTVYAFILGVVINFLNINLGESYFVFSKNFIGAYTILGMMLIGMGLSGVSKENFDFKFVLISFFAKFFIWPLLILGFVFFDSFYLHLYNRLIHGVMFLLSIVPLAANTVAFATELNVKPEKAAVAVFLSTLFAIFFIPISMIFFNNLRL